MRERGQSTTLETAEEQSAEEQGEERNLYLRRGRSLRVASEGLDEVIELRASSGAVELRVRMTEEGPVLQLEGAKLSLKAHDSIEMQCKTFTVDAAESVDLASEGGMTIRSEEEMRIKCTDHIRIRGEKIWLN